MEFWQPLLDAGCIDGRYNYCYAGYCKYCKLHSHTPMNGDEFDKFTNQKVCDGKWYI